MTHGDLALLNPRCPATTVFGASGFIGSWFRRAYEAAGRSFGGTSRAPEAGLLPFDLLQSAPLPPQLLERPEALVLAGVTRIATCETDPEGTWAANVTGTIRLLERLLEAGVRPTYVSTDYVFDGLRGGYTTTDLPSPSTAYGRQKLAVERWLAENAPAACVVRLGKTYSVSSDDAFLGGMASALTKGRRLRAASDQVLGPIRVEDVVRALSALQAARATGLAHLAGPPRSRLWIARALAAELGCAKDLVEEVELSALELSPPRPPDTSLSPTLPPGISLTPLESSLEEFARSWRKDHG